jgi:hypothetical protein
MVNRKCEQKVLEKFDPKGKKFIHYFAKQMGVKIKQISEGGNRYGVDFIIEDPTGKCLEKLGLPPGTTIAMWEVEIKTAWVSPWFQYKTIHLPGRKATYLGQDIPVVYFIVNSTLSRFFSIPGSALDGLTPDQVDCIQPDNTYIKEDMFNVPVDAPGVKEWELQDDSHFHIVKK